MYRSEKMQNYQANIEDLSKCTVAIRNSIGDNVLGTGVIVTDDGLILTCYHVIEDEKTKAIHKTVHVSFPSVDYNGRIKGHATLIDKYCDPALDIAFLQLQEKLPEQTSVAILSEEVEDGHTFKSFGFRKSQTFDGINSYGRIDGKTRKKLEENKLSPEVIQLYSDGIDHGMSGAAVLDTQINRVIGIVSEYLATSSNVDKNLALAIPIESIIQVYPELKQKNPGLRILEFLRKIGAEGITKYERISELFVPPLEYDEIKKILEKDRIIFITGTKEYGKTYTAVHLLWEYFNKGYEPDWVKGGNAEKRSNVRDKFENIERYLKPYNIIYFEDPFGQTEYEVTVDDRIIRNIANIIETVEIVDNANVIITSEEEVFKEFEHRITAELDLRKFEKKIRTFSYDYEKRKEMILRYATFRNCNWLEDKDLSKTVLETIKDESKLPTPLNIEQFATATKNVLEKDKLLEKIDAKSIETPRSFAQEIKTMSEDKIIFLLSLYILEPYSSDFLKFNYQHFIKVLIKEQEVWDFDRVLDWFKDDKIDIRSVGISGGIRFSHPSYKEAIKYVISENGYLTKQGRVLSSILLMLANDEFLAYGVSMAVISNFDKLPENVRNILFELANDEFTVWGVVQAISSYRSNKLPDDVRNLIFKLDDNKVKRAKVVAYYVANNFDKLPANVREELLLKASDNKHATVFIAEALAKNFDKLPESLRNNLLVKVADNIETAGDNVFKLADNKKTAGHVADAIADNFDMLPEDVQNLLFKLADNKEIARDVADAIASNFEKLPKRVQNLLFKLADNKETAVDVACSIIYNFDKLPDDVRNLIFRLGDNIETAVDVGYAVKHNFDKLPANVREELLIKLADKDKTGGVSSTVASNFDKLPANVQNLLFKLADNEGAARDVADAIASNFEKLPKRVQNLLFKLADNKEIAGDVADAIGLDFDKLPANVREELLIKLADKDKAPVRDVAYAIASNFDKLPANVQNLLFKLADNKEIAGDVADVVVYLINKLPANVQNLLFKLADNKEIAQKIANSINTFNIFHKLPENMRNELLIKLAHNKETDRDLARILSSNSNFDKLPDDVRNELLIKLADNTEAAVYVAIVVANNFDSLPKNMRNELLIKLADNKKAAEYVAKAVSDNFDRLPDNVRNEILRKLEKE